MAANDKEELKERIANYLKSKKVYNEENELTVQCKGDVYYVFYGSNTLNGIVGFGQTADGAYNDFVDNCEYNSELRKGETQ
jgi:hypothetical protein